MKSKAVALFLTLGLTTTLVSCNGSDTGGEEGGTEPTQPNPTKPDNGEGGEGGEGGESSVLPFGRSVVDLG